MKAGELLNELDSRQIEADLKIDESNLSVAAAQVGVAVAMQRTTQDQYEPSSNLGRYRP
jgi:multidrug efflux pump subunit AcrA (membrane-fusion protein)